MTTSVKAAPHILSTAAPVVPALYMANIINGSDVCGPSTGLKFVPTLYPTKMRTGADSPMTLATDNMIPVIMPDIAVGRTIRAIVFHFGTPNA